MLQLLAVYLTAAPKQIPELFADDVTAEVFDSAKNTRDSPGYKPENGGRVVTQIEKLLRSSNAVVAEAS